MGAGVLGASVGDKEGGTVGDSVVGLVVGKVVGEVVGLVVGEGVGEIVGLVVGLAVGEVVGLAVGDAVGDIVGEVVGAGVVQSSKSVPLKNSIPNAHLHPVMGDPDIMKQNWVSGLNPFPVLFVQISSCSSTV